MPEFIGFRRSLGKKPTKKLFHPFCFKVCKNKFVNEIFSLVNANLLLIT